VKIAHYDKEMWKLGQKFGYVDLAKQSVAVTEETCTKFTLAGRNFIGILIQDLMPI